MVIDSGSEMISMFPLRNPGDWQSSGKITMLLLLGSLADPKQMN